MKHFFRALAPCLAATLFGFGAGSAGAQPLGLYQDAAAIGARSSAGDDA